VLRTIAAGNRRISLGALLFCAGLTFWIGNMLLHTGGAGFAALSTSMLFLIALLLVTCVTRTTRIGRLAGFYCLGGTMMSVMYLVALAIGTVEPNIDAPVRQFLVPFMEETLKLAPVAFILWRQRNAQLWTLGASDVLLMAAASGAGFGLVEDAYIRMHNGGWQSPVEWLPLAHVYGDHLSVGHGTWTSIAGATLGLALLWRRGGRARYVLAAGGWFWAFLDHSANNYSVARSGPSVDLLQAINGHGYFSVAFFFAAVVVVVAADLYVVHGTLPLNLQSASRFRLGLKAIGAWWIATLERRKLAYLMFHARAETGPRRAELLINGALMHYALTTAPAGG